MPPECTMDKGSWKGVLVLMGVCEGREGHLKCGSFLLDEFGINGKKAVFAQY